MAKYIAILALVAVAILVGTFPFFHNRSSLMASPKVPPLVPQVPYEQLKNPIWVSTTNQMIMGESVTSTVVRLTSGPYPATFIFGPHFDDAPVKEYQRGPSRMVTGLTDTYRPFRIMVMTSTDMINWQPVSFGDMFQETKEPRYFRMWTAMDESSFYAEKAIEEFRKRQQQRK